MGKTGIKASGVVSKKLLADFLNPNLSHQIAGELSTESVERNRAGLQAGIERLDLADLCVMRKLIESEVPSKGHGPETLEYGNDLGFAEKAVERAIQERSHGRIRPGTGIGNLTITALAFGRSAGLLIATPTSAATVAGGVEKLQLKNGSREV